MRPILPALRHYARLFREAVHDGGWRYALRRTRGFLRHKLALWAASLFSDSASAPYAPEISPFAPIIETLPHRALDRPLILIVSNCAIRQCIHYRIRQKIRILNQIGIQAMHLAPTEGGRIRTFLPLTQMVIVYRTALPAKQIAEYRAAGARVVFEFDDLIVGRVALENAGILDQVTEHQARGLLKQADELLDTARLADALIVSTPFLAAHYARPEHGLADKPSFVIPNFVETDDFQGPEEKRVTFAFTSPSGSIQTELAMLTAFLHGFDAAATEDWSILVMGNLLAHERLSAQNWRRGQVIAHPFSDFDEYLHTIGTAETVLIPLADTSFNRAKTPIRLMDAAIAGTQAVFCPVGDYGQVQEALAGIAPNSAPLCVSSNDWTTAGERIGPLLARRAENTAALQEAVRRCFGTAAARRHYDEVFATGLPAALSALPARAEARPEVSA